VGSTDVMLQNPQYLYHFTELSPAAVQGTAAPIFPYLHLRCVPAYLDDEPTRSLAAFSRELADRVYDLETALKKSLETSLGSPGTKP